MSVPAVDLDALRAMAYRVLGESDIVYELKPGGAFDSASAAMAGSAVGAALARAGSPTDATFVAFSNCLRRTGEKSLATAMGYENAMEELRQQLAAIGTSFEAHG